MGRIALLGLLTAGLAVASPALAEDRAVVIVQRSQGATLDLDAIAGRFRSAGMVTAAAADVQAAQLPGPLSALQAPDAAPGARVVVLAGRFANAGGETWLLASDAGGRGLAFAERDGVSVGHVVNLMRDGGRQGVLMLAEVPGGTAPGPRLKPGVGQMRGAAGVSVIAGPPDAIARAAEALSAPGASVAVALLSDPGLRLVSGPAGTALGTTAGRPATTAPAAAVAAAGGLSAPALPGEPDAWVRAAAQRSEAAYTEFLRNYPNGRYAAVARQRITQMGGTPPAEVAPAPPAPAATSAAPGSPAPAATQDSARAAVAEIGLNLSLGERSQLQRILTGLGYDTGGTDGNLGGATRAAIRRWQADAGQAATGYLDADQLARLRRGAGLR